MSKLLLDDKPLIILPSLAERIGLNESIVLQQLHYWLNESKNFREGRKWIYNTYKDWKKQFPFWSEKTIRRTITKLENEGYILSGNFNKLKIDQTKWYSIDYDMLVSRPLGQNDQLEETNCPDGDGQNDHTNNHRLPQTTSETTKDNIPFSEIVSYLNEKTQSSYKASSSKTKDLITARWNQGFTLDDFKTVIDKKSAEWLNSEMNKYLRPETLFGTKFESYLNQKGEVKGGAIKQDYAGYNFDKERELQF